MVILNGKTVSNGTAIAKIYYYRDPELSFDNKKIDDVEAELYKYQTARDSLIKELDSLKAKGVDDSLMDAYILIASSTTFVKKIEDFISIGYNSAYSVSLASKELIDFWTGLGDSLMSQRIEDIKDISDRIIRKLLDIPNTSIDLEQDVILAADNLAPSAMAALKHDHIKGIILRAGTENSHTAIMAKSKQIPAIFMLGDDLLPEYDGLTAIIDGKNNRVIFEPDEDIREKYLKLIDEELEAYKLYKTVRGQENISADGKRLEILCNVGELSEAEKVIDNDGAGIGLFRTEFMFMNAEHYPTVEEQFEIYKAIAQKMDGKKVVIRTLDLGSDKLPAYVEIPKEANPALGMRGIRFCIDNPEIFKTQLRAIYRAAAFGNIELLFPMITSKWEIERCIELCDEVKTELKESHARFNATIKFGIMIETPAAVLMAQEFAKMVDFFSIGTNDLTQYIMAWDRDNKALPGYADESNEALIKSISMVIEAGHKNNIRVSICGNLAANRALWPLYLKYGLDEISVAPSEVLKLRYELKNTSSL